MKSDFEVTAQFKKHHRATMGGLSLQYNNTKECQSFYAGDIMSYRDSVQFSTTTGLKKKAMVQFNRCKPYVNAVKGFMAQNRREAKYVARIESEPVRNLYTRYCNSLKQYVRDNANADQIETQQDGDMLIAGYGAVETAMTYGAGHSTTDPNGQIVMGRLDPLLVGWDPFARDTGLLDARWAYYQRKYALSDAMDLFDDAEEQDFEPTGDEAMGEDNGYQWYANGGRYNKIKELGVDWSDEAAQMVNVFFYQWIEYETFYRADNPIYKLKNPDAVQLAAMQLDALAQEYPEHEDQFDFNPRAEILTFGEDIKARLSGHFEEFVEIYEYKRKVFYSAVLSGDHVFTKFKSPYQSGFSIKFKTGDFDSKNKIWTGIVNSMKEPITYYNKALTELMFIIGANSKGGVLVEEGAVDDIAVFEQRYAKTDAVIVVKDGAVSQNKIRAKKEPFSPTGYENVIQLADASINDAVGIDKTFLGSSENKNETGLLQKRRIKQVVSSLACYFDAITLYQKEHARLLLDFMRIYAENNDGSIFRIVGEDGKDEFLKISEDKLAADYDVSIQEASQSAEEKQEYVLIMNAIGDKLLQAGDAAGAKAVYAIAIKNLPLDQSDAQSIMQILVPQAPQVDPAYVQQLEAQVKALMSEVTQADVKRKMSDIALNTAKMDETAARTHQILAQANKTQQDAVKAGIENVMMKSGTLSSMFPTVKNDGVRINL